MAKLMVWLAYRTAGRKTYLLAGAIAVGVVLAVALGKLSPAIGVATLVAVSAAVFGRYHKALEAHRAEEVHVMEEVAIAGADLAHHNVSAAVGVAVQAVQDGAALDAEIEQEVKA